MAYNLTGLGSGPRGAITTDRNTENEDTGFKIFPFIENHPKIQSTSEKFHCSLIRDQYKFQVRQFSLLKVNLNQRKDEKTNTYFLKKMYENASQP